MNSLLKLEWWIYEFSYTMFYTFEYICNFCNKRVVCMNKYIWVSRNKSNKRCEDFYGKKYKTLFKDIYIYIYIYILKAWIEK